MYLIFYKYCHLARATYLVDFLEGLADFLDDLGRQFFDCLSGETILGFAIILLAIFARPVAVKVLPPVLPMALLLFGESQVVGDPDLSLSIPR